MNEIERVLDIIKVLGVSNIVCEKSLLSILNEKNDFVINAVYDDRSAAFEALGIAKIQESRVALLVDEHYLSNIFTAITEAWFQRINILVVTINGIYYQSLEYLDRCVVGKSLLNVNRDEEIINSIKEEHGPYLLRTNIQLNTNDKIDYSSILCRLKNFLDTEDLVLCYNMEAFSTSSFRVVNISLEHKYCSISKYVGRLLGRNQRQILCIPEALLAFDSNIFNFRNIADSFFVIIIADETHLLHNIYSWILSNRINVKETSIIEDVKIENRTIFYINN